ncbi:MAG: type II secretion system protein GspE, partial [Pseudobdellovibrionaceae bacterium]|nr:type II secretion system protein GspE [Pseudobdellovibrionaceae bacterium]
MDLPLVLAKVTSLSQEMVELMLNMRARSVPLSLRDYLLSKEYQQAEDVLAELCRELGVAFLKEIPINDISPDLVRDISINFCKSHYVLPYKEEKDHILVLTANPFQYQVIKDFSLLFDKPSVPVVSTSSKILDAINRVYERSTANLSDIENLEVETYDSDDQIIDLLEAEDDEAPVIKFVNSILFRAVKEKASDIHIEPYEKESVYRFRINGIMQ